jgi:riboflavin synthase
MRIAHSPELGQRLSVGASLAVCGVCLTVLEDERTPRLSAVELSPETLARTSLGQLHRGDPVNLEPSLCAGDPLGGHWVQGHVDTTVELLERRDLGDHRELAFAMPADLAAYLVEKGSVALDGVSLTISAVAADRFEVALIPHTLQATTLSRLTVGDRVNLEVDILAKYIARALEARGLIGPASPE